MRKILLACSAWGLLLMTSAGCPLFGLPGTEKEAGSCDYRTSKAMKPRCIDFGDDYEIQCDITTDGKWTLGGVCPEGEPEIGTCEAGNKKDHWYDGDPLDIMAQCARDGGTWIPGTKTYVSRQPAAAGSGWHSTVNIYPPTDSGMFNVIKLVIDAVGNSKGGGMAAYYHSEVKTQQDPLKNYLLIDIDGTTVTSKTPPTQPPTGQVFFHKGDLWSATAVQSNQPLTTTTLTVKSGDVERVSYAENSFPGGGVLVTDDDTIYWPGVDGAQNRIVPTIQPFAHVFTSGAHQNYITSISFDSITKISSINLGLFNSLMHLFWLQSDKKLVAFRYDTGSWFKLTDFDLSPAQYGFDDQSTLTLLNNKHLLLLNGSKVQVFSFNGTNFVPGAAGTLPGTPGSGVEWAADADNIYAVYQDSTVENKLTVAKIAGGTVSTVGIQGFTTVGQLIPKIAVVGGKPTVLVAAGIVSVVTDVNQGHLFVMQPD